MKKIFWAILILLVILGGIYWYFGNKGTKETEIFPQGSDLGGGVDDSSKEQEEVSESDSTKNQEKLQEKLVACTADAMQCPDGSYVGRTGPNCEFVCPDGISEDASGIITSFYSKDGRYYIDIDYVDINPNWVPGEQNSSAYTNVNSKIRTFVISGEVQSILTEQYNGYRVGNPWDVKVLNGTVVEIKEHFVS